MPFALTSVLYMRRRAQAPPPGRAPFQEPAPAAPHPPPAAQVLRELRNPEEGWNVPPPLPAEIALAQRYALAAARDVERTLDPAMARFLRSEVADGNGNVEVIYGLETQAAYEQTLRNVELQRQRDWTLDPQRLLRHIYRLERAALLLAEQAFHAMPGGGGEDAAWYLIEVARTIEALDRRRMERVPHSDMPARLARYQRLIAQRVAREELDRPDVEAAAVEVPDFNDQPPAEPHV